MAASESEFSMSSSSKSASLGGVSPPSASSPLARSEAGLNGVALAGAAGGAGVCARPPGAGAAPTAAGSAGRRGRSRRRHGLGVGAGIGRFEVDDVAQEDLALVELVAPDDDGLEGERALAQAGDHRLAAGLDALGDGDFALARQQLHRAHFAQIHAHGIVGALGRLLGLGLGRHLLLDFDQLAALALGLLVGLLALLLAFFGRLLGLDDVDAHLAEHGENVLDLLGIDLLGGQDRIDLVVGDVAALLGGADQLLDGRIGEIEQRQRRIGGLGALFFRRLFLFFLFLCRLGLAHHASLLKTAPAGAPLKTSSLPYAGRIERPNGPHNPGRDLRSRSDSHRRSVIGAAYAPINPPCSGSQTLFPGSASSPGPLLGFRSSRIHSDRTGRPEEAPKPSISASVPSSAARRAFTSCNQE